MASNPYPTPPFYGSVEITAEAEAILVEIESWPEKYRRERTREKLGMLLAEIALEKYLNNFNKLKP